MFCEQIFIMNKKFQQLNVLVIKLQTEPTTKNFVEILRWLRSIIRKQTLFIISKEILVSQDCLKRRGI